MTSAALGLERKCIWMRFRKKLWYVHMTCHSVLAFSIELINQFVLLHLRVLIGPHIFYDRPRHRRYVTCLGNFCHWMQIHPPPPPLSPFCRGAQIFKQKKLKKLVVALKFLFFLTVLSLNSNFFLLVLFACKDPSPLSKSSKRRNHLKPENLETLCYTQRHSAITSYRAETKYLKQA